jgi:hypothetical protein
MTLSPPEQMSRLLTGYWITQALYVAAKLRLADLLAAGPVSAEDLAQRAEVHPQALYRLLRALASVGVFVEDAQHRFALTPLGDCLRGDAPGSQRALALMNGEEHYQTWGELLYSIKTGQVAFDKLYGMPVFQYLAHHPEQASTFDEAMVGVHGRETAAMLDAYDFKSIGVLADIGGGNGSLLAAVLTKHPATRGVLYDLPGVIARARNRVGTAGWAGRCQLIEGNFFESVPAGADAYLMRHIIHDWDDEKSSYILRNIHRAMKAESKLLLVEGVVPPGNGPSFTKLLDLTMLLIPGGKERTEEEYRQLLKECGFRLQRIVPTRSEVSVLESTKM